MAKHLFRVPCPCCNKMIEVDTRSGKARAMRADEAEGGRDLDDLFAAQKKDSERLDDLFSSAKDTEKHRGDELDQKLKRARDEARKDGDEDRPRNIFDLD